MATRDPVADLKRIAFLLERANEATYRVRAFRTAASALSKLSEKEIAERASAGTLAKLQGVGDVTARCVAESLAGEEPVYLRGCSATEGSDVDETGAGAAQGAPRRLPQPLRLVRRRLTDRGDGDGRHDHRSRVPRGHRPLPRLTVARGLSPDRLREQLDVIEALNETLTSTARPCASSAASRSTSWPTARWIRRTSCWSASTSSSPPSTVGSRIRPTP
jgi:putative hydrolase